MRSILITILLVVGLSSQSIDDLRLIAEKGFDTFSLIKKQIQTLESGEFLGVELTPQEKEEMLISVFANLNSISTSLGGEVQIIETIVEVAVKAEASQEAIDFFQKLADNPLTYFYKSQRDKGITSEVQNAIDLLKE